MAILATFKKLSAAGKLVCGSVLITFISIFLPWKSTVNYFSDWTANFNAFQTGSDLFPFILIILVACVYIVIFWRELTTDNRFPYHSEKAVLVAGILITLIAIVRWFTIKREATSIYLHEPAWGLLVTISSGLLLIFAAVWEIKGELPLPKKFALPDIKLPRAKPTEGQDERLSMPPYEQSPDNDGFPEDIDQDSSPEGDNALSENNDVPDDLATGEEEPETKSDVSLDDYAHTTKPKQEGLF
jgi:hypothetical protein